MNFVEIPTEDGPILLNLDHVASVQVRHRSGGPALAIGMRDSTESQIIMCKEAQAVYEFLSEKIRPTSFVARKEGPIGFGSRAS
ncbi:MAG: hypothetical protein EOP84_05300 [Verrucomicrobiaceae bacterium]|nr:MAG: hypothetical protein EOP84_05300 [Verrucomicrobiaceae bacterium]